MPGRTERFVQRQVQFQDVDACAAQNAERRRFGMRADQRFHPREVDMAGSGEVLVSRTTRDLAVGSTIEFADRGMHTLKGVPEPWQVFAARC